jgi:NRAMP (natural resistance-associated macrophage protein)-like metal ion transporter
MGKPKIDQVEQQFRKGGIRGRIKAFLGILGPGLISGAADDDPSGIGTFSQTGAQFGYTQLWATILTLPLMVAIQEICARIALETGSGLAAVIRKHYPKPVLYGCIILLFGANAINLGADLGAMAAAGQLLLPLPFFVWLVGISLLTLGLEIFLNYNQYARVLRFLTLSLLAYVFAAFVVHQDWGQALRGTFIPTLQFDRARLMNLVALLGTTISPYLFFWQASQEVEEEIDKGRKTLTARRGITKTELKWMRTDVISGMVISNLVVWFIIVTTASTLYRNGITEIDSAAKAAQALRPLAGNFASLIFSAGIIGTGLLAVPILAGAAAYAMADTFKWPEGLSLKLKQAPQFYGVIILATAIGAGMNLLGINPIKALYYSAILNGLVAPPLLILLMLISNSRKIMRNRINGRLSNWVGGIAALVMTVAAVALLISLGSGQ